MQMPETYFERCIALRRDAWLLRAAVVKIKAARLAAAIRASAKYDPNQPRVPRGNPDGGQWTDAGGGGGGGSPSSNALAGGADNDRFEDLPQIPKESPPSRQERNSIVKQIVRYSGALDIVLRTTANAIGETVRSPIEVLATAVELAPWVVTEFAPHINAYFDPPKTLEELQQAVSEPQLGYDIHHIVEKGSAAEDGFPEGLIDGPENLVRIPRLKHWQITGWYMTGNEDYDGLSPRNYLRGKDWNARIEVGLKALRKYEVLKP
jgi:hypothetical protein